MRRCRSQGQTQALPSGSGSFASADRDFGRYPLAMILHKPKMLAVPVAVHAD
jgi:hypothetical protein